MVRFAARRCAPRHSSARPMKGEDGISGQSPDCQPARPSSGSFAILAAISPTANALSFWEDNWPSLAPGPQALVSLVVAWQPKLISKDEVRHCSLSGE